VIVSDNKSSQLLLDGAYDVWVKLLLFLHLFERLSCTLFAPLMTTAWTAGRPFDEMAVTLFTFPPYPHPGFSPHAPCFRGNGAFDVSFAVRLSVSGITIRPLIEFGRIPWALGTADMATLLTNSGHGGYEVSLAVVTTASDTLLDLSIDSFLTVLVRHSQALLLLGGLDSLLLLALFG
jgi:hypothetical protein